MAMQIFDCVQGSPEWFAARLGLPTASEFHTVLAKGKDGGASITRKIYMLKLAGESLTGKPMTNYQNSDMERGKEFEDEAREAYSFVTDAEVQRVGFIRRDNAGASPDALVGTRSGLEIKCPQPHIQIERLLKAELPTEHRAQVQGNMWIAGRDTWDFVSYCPGLPLFVKPVPRDDGFIAMLKGGVAQFNEELAAIIERIHRYGEPSPVMQQLKDSVAATGTDPDKMTTRAVWPT